MGGGVMGSWVRPGGARTGIRGNSREQAEETYKREQPEPLTFGRDQLVQGDGYMQVVTAAVSSGHPLTDKVKRTVHLLSNYFNHTAYTVEMASQGSESARTDLINLGGEVEDLAIRNIGRIVALEEFGLLPPAPEES